MIIDVLLPACLPMPVLVGEASMQGALNISPTVSWASYLAGCQRLLLEGRLLVYAVKFD